MKKPEEITTRADALEYLEASEPVARCLGPFSRKTLFKVVNRVQAGSQKVPDDMPSSQDEEGKTRYIFEELQEYEKSEALEEACQKLKAQLLNDGRLEAARFVHLMFREPCGNDNIRTVAHKGPLDGEVHEARCPKCGRPFTYRAPGPEFPKLPVEEIYPKEE